MKLECPNCGSDYPDLPVELNEHQARLALRMVMLWYGESPIREIQMANDMCGLHFPVRQIEAALTGQDGWQLVPKEPTKEMIQASIWALDRWREKNGNVQGHVPPGEKYQIRWQAMLAAAPPSVLVPKTTKPDFAGVDTDF